MQDKCSHQATEKHMKDIVPYSELEKEVLAACCGSDITDNIVDVHDADAEFVSERDWTHGGNVCKYTGWWKNQNPDGRGTYRTVDGRERYDNLWKNGKRHGTGRCLNVQDKYACQGTYDNDSYKTTGMRCFKSSGKVFTWNHSLNDFVEEAITKH